MCGLAGMAGDFNYRAKDLLKELLVVASLRGKDSTGVAGINIKTNVATLAKAVGNPYDLFEYRPFDRISSHDSSVLIGHCRHKTHGEVSKANAHPFDVGRVVGAHNGTLQMPWRMAKEMDVPEYGTDSEILYACIAKHGLKKAMAAASGAWALTWWDRENKTLNFLRNSDRPLWIAYSEGMKHIYWASEWWMLEGLLARHNVKLWEDKAGHKFFLIPEDTHFAFQIPENGSDKIKCVTEEEVKGGQKKADFRVPFQWEDDDLPTSMGGSSGSNNANNNKTLVVLPPENTKTQGGSGTTQSSGNQSSTTSTQTNSNTSTKSSRPLKPTLTLVRTDKKSGSDEPMLVGPGGREISKQEFDLLLKNGCQWCSATLEPEDKIAWLPSSDGYVPICDECSDPGSQFNAYMMG